jgi:hypothetical protein
MSLGVNRLCALGKGSHGMDKICMDGKFIGHKQSAGQLCMVDRTMSSVWWKGQGGEDTQF